MLEITNTIVQALVWTTAAGLLYAIWLRSQTTSRYKVDISFYWQQVVQVLQWLWVIMAIGLLISMLVFAWPKPTSAAAARPISTDCAASIAGSPYASPFLGVSPSSSGLCNPSNPSH